MQIFLPRSGAKSAELLTSAVSSDPKSLVWRFASVEHGALLTFELADAAKRHLFDGEVHIRWIPESQGPGLNLLLIPPVDTGLQLRARELNLNLSPDANRTAEDATEKFWTTLTEAQKAEALSQLGEDEPSNAGAALKAPPKLSQPPGKPFAFMAPSPPAQLARTTIALDESKIKRDLIRSQLVCKFEAEQHEWPLIKQDQCAALSTH
jgi:hypothetical protein